jgi:hypothetical protein
VHAALEASEKARVKGWPERERKRVVSLSEALPPVARRSSEAARLLLALHVASPRIEEPFTLPCGEHTMRGVVDWACDGMVVDYKTCSAAKWIPEPEALRARPQPQIYAYWHMQEYGSPPGTVRFIYVATAGAPGAVPVDVFYSRAELISAWDKIRAECDEAAIIATFEVGAVPGHDGRDHPACRAYGGCPHRLICS